MPDLFILTEDDGGSIAYQSSPVPVLVDDVNLDDTYLLPENGEPEIIVVSDSGVQGPPGVAGEDAPIYFGRDEEVDVVVGEQMFLFGFDAQLIKAYTIIRTAPQGNPVVLDINVNDVSIWTNPNDRLKILAGQNRGEVVLPTPLAIQEGDYVTVDIDEIGTTVPGANLSVFILYRRTP